MKTCWTIITPDQAGNYVATPGGRYAVLISADARASLSDVTSDLSKQGFTINYEWMTGQKPSTGTFTDNWLATLPAPTAGTVWMYLDVTYTGSALRTIAGHFEKCFLLWCGSATISYAFSSQQVADDFYPCGPGDPGPSAPAPSAPPAVPFGYPETTTPPTPSAMTCPPLPPPCRGCPPAPNPAKPLAAGAAAGAALVGLLWWWRG